MMKMSLLFIVEMNVRNCSLEILSRYRGFVSRHGSFDELLIDINGWVGWLDPEAQMEGVDLTPPPQRWRLKGHKFVTSSFFGVVGVEMNKS